MSFGKLVNIVLPIIAIIFSLSILFAAYNFKAKEFKATSDECKQRGGIMVKSSDVWSCIKAEKL